MQTITALDPPALLTRVADTGRPPLRVGVVQHHWHDDAQPNRYGAEGLITFYGSSFISDPYGRILVQAPRDESAVLVADLDLEQHKDWLSLFPFLTTRRPDTYGELTAPVTTAQPFGRQ